MWIENPIHFVFHSRHFKLSLTLLDISWIDTFHWFLSNFIKSCIILTFHTRAKSTQLMLFFKPSFFNSFFFSFARAYPCLFSRLAEGVKRFQQHNRTNVPCNSLLLLTNHPVVDSVGWKNRKYILKQIWHSTIIKCLVSSKTTIKLHNSWLVFIFFPFFT